MLRPGLQRPDQVLPLHLPAERGHPAEVAAAAGVHHDRRVSGHRPDPVPAHGGAVRLPQEPVRGGRPGPDHLHLAWGQCEVPAGIRQAVPRRQDHPHDGQLPLHPGDPGGCQLPHCQEPGADQKGPDSHPAPRFPGALPPGGHPVCRGGLDRGADQGPPRHRRSLPGHGGALPGPLCHPGGGGGSAPGEAALHHLQRGPVLRPHGDQGRPELSANDRLPG